MLLVIALRPTELLRRRHPPSPRQPPRLRAPQVGAATLCIALSRVTKVKKEENGGETGLSGKSCLNACGEGSPLRRFCFKPERWFPLRLYAKFHFRSEAGSGGRTLSGPKKSKASNLILRSGREPLAERAGPLPQLRERGALKKDCRSVKAATIRLAGGRKFSDEPRRPVTLGDKLGGGDILCAAQIKLYEVENRGMHE